ncbi:hypothetical protein DL769_006068 [Monosporascus sp. CRB-8-3]|nr:hypothetical protein DL769_006068 [Monosporascus sp. CRB-8-3]
MHIAQVNAWSEGPRYTAVGELPAPSDHQLQLRVLAAGLHQVVRSRAAGQHYSAKELPHVVGVDCVGRHEATGRLYYVLSFKSGTFAEYVNVEKANAYPLPEGADPVAFAASVNPAMSSWMALTQRTSGLARGFTVLILGATSASGRLAAYAARELGAGKVIGVARDAAALESLEGFDERIVLRDPVQETDFSKVGRECDVILDYVYGDAALHLLSSLGSDKPVQYVNIGGLAQQTATIPSALLRSRDLTVRGAGPGAWGLPALGREMPTLVEKMATWKLLDAQTVPLKDIEQVWDDKELGRKGRVVFVP